MTPELNAKIAIWRQKQTEGTMTIEEYKEAILTLRAGRISAAIASETSKKKTAAAKAPKAVPRADDLLADLEGL
jgi:hypothetical protein